MRSQVFKLLMVVLPMLAAAGVFAPVVAAEKFTASSYPITISGPQMTMHVFLVQGQKTECNSVTLTGTLSSESPEVEVTPEYSECTAFGFVNAKVEMNGCKYLFTVESGSGDNFGGGMQVKCPEGKSITITGGTCIVHIPPQTPKTSSVDYKVETGSPNKVLLTWTVKGIHSAVTKGNFLCPLVNSSTETTGSYSGTTLLSRSGGGDFDVGPKPPEEGFTSSSYPATISGSQGTRHVFLVQGQKTECNSVTMTGTLSMKSPELEVTPEYSECTAFGFVNAKVEMNGCKYLFTVESGSGDNFGGDMEIRCPEGKSIAVVGGSCTVHIPGQTPTTDDIDYKVETGSPNEVLLTWTASGIHSAVTKGSFLCPLVNSSTETTGSYSGTTLLSRSGGGDFDVDLVEEYTASSYPATLTGTHTTQHVLEVQGKTVKCNTASSSSELTARSTSLEAGVTYSECTAFGFSGASFNTNGCTFVLEKPALVESHKFTASTSIKCPAGKEMVIKGGNCEALIAAQGPLSSTTLTNMTGSPNTLTAKTELTGLIVNAKSGAGCPLEEKVVSNATYTGVTEFKGSGGVGVDVGS